MNEVICKAINETCQLAFIYKGVQRRVEPHAYGSQPNGKDGLCAWQLGGGSGDGYRFYLVVEMTGVSVSEQFDGPRPDYRRGDRRFSHIYAEL
jgi:hypothetical protein